MKILLPILRVIQIVALAFAVSMFVFNIRSRQSHEAHGSGYSIVGRDSSGDTLTAPSITLAPGSSAQTVWGPDGVVCWKDSTGVHFAPGNDRDDCLAGILAAKRPLWHKPGLHEDCWIQANCLTTDPLERN